MKVTIELMIRILMVAINIYEHLLVIDYDTNEFPWIIEFTMDMKIDYELNYSDFEDYGTIISFRCLSSQPVKLSMKLTVS